MMKRLLFILLALLLLGGVVYGERKKVGLVLSGGGAKGVAHIGVLKVLEEAGIPIDYIAGTSMGAIVGGLYSIGYDARMLDSLVRVQDWMFLLSDKVYRNNLPFSEKETNEKYLVSFPLSQRGKLTVPAGFISGQNIFHLFSELTMGYHDSLSFMNLPIPFSCVSANLVDGKEVVMNNGKLPLAMRASMAIPGAFAPVILDSMVLVDGGISNNFPVDVARNMGAEITIGVDLSTGLKDMEGLNSMMGIVDQLTSFMGMKSYQKNKELVNLYMNPDLMGYNAASFTKEAIDTMILRGERVARAHWDEIMKLKEQIGLEPDENATPKIENKFLAKDSIVIGHIYIDGMGNQDEKWIRKQMGLREFSVITVDQLHKAITVLYGTGIFSNVEYVLNGDSVYDLTMRLKQKLSSSLNFGFRFDSEEMASILLNTTINSKSLRGRLSLTGRLNKNPYARVDYSFGSTLLRKLGLSYMYKYSDLNLYDHGDKVDNVTYSYHMGDLSFSDIYFRNCKFQLGLRYEFFDYKSDLFYNADYRPESVKSKGFFNYYASLRYDTYDKKYYPTKGITVSGDYTLYTDNMVGYNDRKPFSAVAANFESAVRLTRRVYWLPAVYGRVLIGGNIPYPYLNCMGGEVPGRYMAQQLAFTGIHRLELFENSLLVARMAFRYRLGANHYVSLIGNYAKQADNFFRILKGDDIWGGGVGYSYDSFVGPISLTLDISNWDKKPGFYFNLGYYF